MRQSSERLSFERLEDRMLLSTLVVNSLADNTTAGDGLVTLREAIHAANTLGTTDLGDSGSIGLDQIVFASGLSGSILLTSGELDVIGDLLITGNGRNDIVIDAQQNSRIFDVTGVDTDLTLDNLKLQNGRTTSDNNGGGAIRFTATGIGTLSVLNSTLLNNSTAGDSAHGGAIYSLTGDVSVSGSLLNGNWTEGQSSFGGAIASPTAGDINVLNSTLSGNHVDGTSGSGGAIASPSLLGKTVIVGSTITGNEATTGGGIGMFALNLGKSLTIRNCIVAGNIADQHADFTAPGGLLSTLDVTNSLIGDNDGTTLSATLNGVFDSLGNLVGSTTGDGVIDPHLAPLADNGGPTLTHALLPGSLALDSGNNTSSNDAGMVHDQRGAPFLRVYGAGVDMGSFEAQPLVITGSTARLTGTSGSDAIVYRIATGVLNINGIGYVLPDYIDFVDVDGGGGKDFINVIGTSGDEVVTSQTGEFSLEWNSLHTGVDLAGRNLEVIILDGQGGHDTVVMNDSAGDDKFFARPTSGFMIDVTGVHEVDAFGYQLTGVATTGNDLVKFFDSPGDDVLTARPTVSTLSGNGFLHTAHNFDVVVARSVGGTDTANVFGTPGNDAFTARAGIAVLSSTGFNYQLESFALINANGLDGVDLVRFLGGAGADTLVAGPNSAQFQSGGFAMNTNQFERLIGIGGNGADDVAILNDSVGHDLFVAKPNLAELSGSGFFERVTNFEIVSIRGINGGTNRKVMNDVYFQVVEVGSWE